MTCSLKQIEANKNDALKSSGPKTDLGKSISRRNSLKHGLTGEGIVLPHEDSEELDRRFAILEAEMKPANELARQLVNRVALMTVRLDRSAGQEAKAIAHRMRKATAEFDDARLAEIENCYSWIAAEPATNARRLRNSPEGIDRLLGVMNDLRADLKDPEGHRWDWSRCEQFHHLIGLRRGDVPVSRARALTDAIEGDFGNLHHADGGDLEPKPRQQWAGKALVALVDGEIAKLETLRDNFDHEGLALDRAEAGERAMFDASPAAVLARKYESASERGLYRAIREFREVQSIPGQVEQSQPLAAEPADEMGLSLPGPSDSESGPAESDPTPVEGEKAGRSGPSSGGSTRNRGRKPGLEVDRDAPDRRSSTLD